MRTKLLCLLLLCGCTTSNSWVCDGIVSGSNEFDSKRLRFSSVDAPLVFEMLKFGDQIEAFVTLQRASLTPVANVVLLIGDLTYEEESEFHEGRMRLRLSEEMTQRIISSLQADERIVISVNGYEESLEPGQFNAAFANFQGKTSFIQKLIKVPIP